MADAADRGSQAGGGAHSGGNGGPRGNSGGAYVCPYCGGVTPDVPQCPHCRGMLDPLSRQATQNHMGPWFVKDDTHPFRPGCSYSTLAAMVRKGRVGVETILRGPTTHQFWTPARRVPGVAHLLGACHSCGAPSHPESASCAACGADFIVDDDRQVLGLAAVRLLPGQASAEQIAAHSNAVAVGTQDAVRPSLGPPLLGDSVDEDQWTSAIAAGQGETPGPRPTPRPAPPPQLDALRRRVDELEGASRTARGALIALVAMLGLGAVLVSGAVLAGLLRVSIVPPGGAVQPANGAGTTTDETSSNGSADASPTDAAPAPVSPNEPTTDSTAEPLPDVPASANTGEIARAERLLAEGKASEVLKVLEAMTPSDDAEQERIGLLLETARERARLDAARGLP